MPVEACDSCGGEVIMGPVIQQRPAVEVRRAESSRAASEPTPADTKYKEKPKEKSALKNGEKKPEAKPKEPADEQPDLNKPMNNTETEKEDETSKDNDGPEV